MLDYTTLWQGEYRSMISPVKYPYEVMHEVDCMHVLPILKSNVGPRFVLREEFCPAYMVKDTHNSQLFYTTISGRADAQNKGSGILMMGQELREEAGIQLISSDILEHWFIPFAKVSTTRVHVYIIHVTKWDVVPETGDGSEYEKKGNSVEVSEKEMQNVLELPNTDFSVHAMFAMALKYRHIWNS